MRVIMNGMVPYFMVKDMIPQAREDQIEAFTFKGYPGCHHMVDLDDYSYYFNEEGMLRFAQEFGRDTVIDVSNKIVECGRKFRAGI